MTQSIYYLTDDVSWFPNPENALEQPSGLLAIGGDLSPTRVYHAYQQGIFPWFNNDEPIMWWSPDPRAIFDLSNIRCNKSLRKFLRRCNYDVTINNNFDQVIRNCAKPRSDGEGTWILPEMVNTYNKLHRSGKAHSIEVWQWQDNKRQLVGGLYGLLVGSCFCGESMFSFSANASKLALLVLGKLLENTPQSFIDCQLPNPYLTQMGATLVSRPVFLERLKTASSVVIAPELFAPRMIDWREKVLYGRG